LGTEDFRFTKLGKNGWPVCDDGAKSFNIGGKFLEKLEWDVKKRRTSDAFYKAKAIPSASSKLLGNKSFGGGRDQNYRVIIPTGVNA
jgi:hypothetical protein